MKERVMLWAIKYIFKYVNRKILDLEVKKRHGHDVSFLINRYKEISNSMYDLATEICKEIHK